MKRQHEDTKNTMRAPFGESLCSLCLRVVLVCLFAAGFLCGYGFAPQQVAPPATRFPASLLEGNPSFNLAIMLQGDLRGNFGPCG